MKFNLKLIEETFGKTVRDEIEEQNELVMTNLEFLFKLGFHELNDIFYAYAIAFLQDEETFKNKILMLCKKIGNDFVAVLENNLDLWEEIL